MTSDHPTPCDTSAACSEAAGGATAVGAAPLPAIDVDVFCPDCDYNLRGLTGIRCPECGTNVEPFRERGSGADRPVERTAAFPITVGRDAITYSTRTRNIPEKTRGTGHSLRGCFAF